MSAPAKSRQGEGPLAWLASRSDADGTAFLDAPALAAGVRLRRDHALAEAAGRTTMDWGGFLTAGVVSGNRDPAAAGEAGRAARARLAAALAAIGPELSAVAVAVVCEEVGLRDLERSRNWPPRSAKVVLRLALAALARHYGLATVARGPVRPRPPRPRA